MNVYDKNPRGKHNESYHVNVNYNKKTISITEKSNGKVTRTQGSCFLTTACMKHHLNNFDDNCYELTVLRWFRDNFVSIDDIDHYYQTAPIIVEAIDQDEDKDAIYEKIYDEVINYCVTKIENCEYEEAYNKYKSCIMDLEERYARSLTEQRLLRTLQKI